MKVFLKHTACLSSKSMSSKVIFCIRIDEWSSLIIKVEENTSGSLDKKVILVLPV